MRPKAKITVFAGKGEIALPEPGRPNASKTLIIDIETAPIQALLWGTFKQTLYDIEEQVQEDWTILSYAAKWADASKVFYEATGGRGPEKVRDDSILMPGLWALLNEARMIVAQNGTRFDIKKINARLMIHNMPPYASGVHIYDTLIASRRIGAFTSHKLGWLSTHLTDTPKSKHKKFPGWELWTACLKDNPAAWAEMKKYNIQDIRATEKLWLRQRPWVQNRVLPGTYLKG